MAEAGQENIETVHEPEPIQTIGTLCNGQGRRAMEDPHGPQTQVHEGTCAIKVSMRCSCQSRPYIRHSGVRTDHVCLCSGTNTSHVYSCSLFFPAGGYTKNG